MNTLPPDCLSYAELQMCRSRGHDEARRLGHTSVDIDALEREIAKRDTITTRCLGDGR